MFIFNLNIKIVASKNTFIKLIYFTSPQNNMPRSTLKLWLQETNVNWANKEEKHFFSAKC